MLKTNNYISPDIKGKYGKYGGKYVPETLINALEELEALYNKVKDEESFIAELNDLQKNYNGRQTPLTYAERLTKHYGKAKIYLKRAAGPVGG
jgi:tryptophan synthase beta chain